MEGADGFGDEADAEGGRRSETHASAAEPCELGHLLTDRVGLCEHPLSAGEQSLSGRGEADVPASPMEELGAEFAFESRDLSAQRRLGQVQVLGGAGEVTEAGDLDEPAELLEVHVFSVSIPVEQCIGVISAPYLAWRA